MSRISLSIWFYPGSEYFDCEYFGFVVYGKIVTTAKFVKSPLPRACGTAGIMNKDQVKGRIEEAKVKVKKAAGGFRMPAAKSRRDMVI